MAHADDVEIQVWLDLQGGLFDRAYAELTRAMIVRTDSSGRARLEPAFGVMLQRMGLTADAMDRFSHALAHAEWSGEERSFILAVSSMASAVAGDLVRAEAEAQEALRLGEGTDAAFVTGQAHTTLTLVNLGHGRPREALVHAEAAVSADRQGTGPDEYRAVAHALKGMAYAELDMFEHAEESIANGLRLAEARQNSIQLPILLASQALLDYVHGNWDSALASANHALEVAHDTGLLVARGLAWGIAACVEGNRGNLSVARDLVDQAVANRRGRFGGLGEEWVSLAAAAVASDPRGQYDALCDAWFRLSGVPYQLAWKICAHPLVVAAVDQGDREVAEAVTRKAEDGARRAGEVASARAVALCCRGSLTGSLEQLEAGIALLRTSGRPLPLGLACREASRLAAEAGDQAHSLALLREAAEAFQQLGATVMSAMIAADVVQASTRSAGSAATSEEWTSLTDAERRVALLAATGLTNRQIAAQIGVSPRTVQSQLAGACAKFGVSSRVQLAGLVAGIAVDGSASPRAR